MKEVEVVTTFLMHGGKVALFKRSDQVRTYKGCMAGISGYLEGEPSHHFMVEVEEETGLTPYEYRLLRSAPPLGFFDEDLRINWLVHPFLCEVDNPDAIRLDRENSEMVWVRPEEIAAFDTVPGLLETYKAVSRFPLKEQVLSFSDQLSADRRSGARQLALQCLAFLDQLVVGSNAATAGVLVDDLEAACRRLSKVRSSMVTIATTLELLRLDIQTARSEELALAVNLIRNLINEHRLQMESSLRYACAFLKDIVPRGSRVLLHSYSSSIEAALPILKELDARLVVTESRPGMEGRQMAARAVESGLDVTLISDMGASLALKEVDICLFGADGIEKGGALINKTGTALMAAMAHNLGVKVYSLAEIRKISMDEESVRLEEYEAAEIWSEAPAGLKMRNIYFDRTLPRYVSGYVLEQGVIEPYQVRMIIEGQMRRNR